MWGNICLRGTLTIFGYLHLICIARNAMRHAVPPPLLLPTTTPTPLGKRWDPRPPPCASLCLPVPGCGVPNDCRTASLRPPNQFSACHCQLHLFNICAACLLPFFFVLCPFPTLFLFFPPLSLSAVSETTNQPGKTATIEMYAPSSYNDTVTGETLSSVSEKSESYSNEGSQPEYIVSIQTDTGTQTYI